MKLARLQDGKTLAHDGHVPLIKVAKRTRRSFAGYVSMNLPPCIAPLLHRHLSYTEQRLTVLIERRGVAHYEDLRVSLHSEVLLNAYPPGAVCVHIQPLARRRRSDTTSPDDSLAQDAFTCHNDAVFINLVHVVSQPDLHTQFVQLPLGGLGKVLRETTKNAVPRVDQDNSG